VVGTAAATTALSEGQIVTVDGDRGLILDPRR
jgi:phosphohistidine swiveling domain-containing protein